VEHSVERVPTIRLGILIGTTAACAFLSGLVWHSRGPAEWERPLISWLQHDQLPMARPLVLLWEPLPFAVATLLLAWTALNSKRVLLALSGTAGCVAAVIATEVVLKPLLDRHHLHAGSAVFPSGHVTAAAAWAMFAWLVITPPSRLRSALVLVPVMVGWAVVSAGAHYPADALAGVFVGGLVVYAVVIGADRLTTTIANRHLHTRAGNEVYIDRPVDADRTAVAA
jgi:membrane-associated phospholipid phosphatase